MEEREREDERRLIERVRAGERRAFARLIERYERLVRHIVFRMVKDERDREELCQDVFVKVHRHLDSFRGEAKLSTWIARIARNTCLNHLEKKQMPLYADEIAPETESGGGPALTQVPDRGEGPARRAQAEDVRVFLQEEIDLLPEHYRTALMLYHLEGMTVAEIGAVMDNPSGTVKSHLYRGRKKLKDRLLKRFGQEELQVL